MATVHGILKGVGDGDADPGATVDIMLCGYGSRSPVSRGVGSESGSYYTAEKRGITPTLPGNEFNVVVTGNDLIQPAGTYYTVIIRDSNGDILQCNAYLFLGSNDYDLTTTDPYDPTQPPPPLPPLILNQLLGVGVADPTVFSGDQYTAWKIILTGDVDTIEVTDLIPGNLYTFIIQQDGTGGRAFNWDSAGNVFNAAPVNPDPGAYTVQTFVCDDNLDLYAIGAGMWWA